MSTAAALPARTLPPRGLLVALAAQLPLLAAGWRPRPSHLELLAAGCLLVAGTVLNVWAERLFSRAGVGVCPFSPAPTLIRRGPYRWTRNPMYVGLLCLDAAVALGSGVPANLWSAVAYGIWLHYAFVLPEEAFLREALGRVFDDYAETTPRRLF